MNDATPGIERRARFDYIRYANVWEDADVLCAALRPAQGTRILSIASAGDNAFALAAEGAHVVAVDLSAAQLALVELKRAAIRALDYEDLLAFLGVRHSAPVERVATYRRLAPMLPRSTADFWAANSPAVAKGIIHSGKFERFFAVFRRWIVPLFHRRAVVQRLLESKSPDERQRFYEDVWDSWRWRALFRVFFSRRVLGWGGRDPEFFRYVEGRVADRILDRTRYALTALPTHDNPYLRFIFTGGYADTLPRYLQPQRFEAVRRGVDRIELVNGGADVAARSHGPFNGYNLSDIFEYVDPATSESLYGAFADAALPGARLAYWNMLVPRRRPERLASRVTSLESEARALFAHDRAFFYSAFVLEEVA